MSNSKKSNKKESKKVNKKNNQENKKGFWKRHKKFAIFLKVVITLFILMVIVAAGAVVAILSSDKWDISERDLQFTSEDTIIYDKDGNEIANVSGDEKRSFT